MTSSATTSGTTTIASGSSAGVSGIWYRLRRGSGSSMWAISRERTTEPPMLASNGGRSASVCST